MHLLREDHVVSGSRVYYLASKYKNLWQIETFQYFTKLSIKEARSSLGAREDSMQPTYLPNSFNSGSLEADGRTFLGEVWHVRSPATYRTVRETFSLQRRVLIKPECSQNEQWVCLARHSCLLLGTVPQRGGGLGTDFHQGQRRRHRRY